MPDIDPWLEPEPVEALQPTGVPFVDDLLGGVGRQGVHGILGPYGSGKSMLATMLAVAATRQAPDGQVFFLTYEGEPLVRLRALSYATAIPLKALEQGRWMAVVQRHQAEPAARAMMQRLSVLGCDGSTDPAGPWRRGGPGRQRSPWHRRGIAGIADRIAGAVSAGVPVRAVVIDYIGAMASAAAGGDGPAECTDAQAIRAIIERSADEARERLAWPLQCPVWLVHQLSGDENARMARGYLARPGSANGCPGWTDSLDGALILGQENARLGWRRIEAHGHRRPAPGSRYLRFHPEVARLEVVDGQAVERGGRQAGAPDAAPPDDRPLTPDDVFL
jgi:hypothetical protein